MAPIPPWWPKMKLKKTFQTLQFSITIVHNLEAEIDYRHVILFCKVLFQDYAQEVSS